MSDGWTPDDLREWDIAERTLDSDERRLVRSLRTQPVYLGPGLFERLVVAARSDRELTLDSGPPPPNALCQECGVTFRGHDPAQPHIFVWEKEPTA